MGKTANSVHAFETEDGVSSVRVYYHLPRCIERGFAARFDAHDVLLQEFSRQVKRGRDTIAIRRRGCVATGVIGTRRLVVTYRRVYGARPDAAIARFERHIEAAFGPLLRPESMALAS